MREKPSARAHERFRALLIEARKRAGMTQVELSKKLRRPQSFVSKYENGERRLDVPEFLEVTEALGADPQRLLKALQRGE